MRELIYRDDCDLFVESANYEEMIDDLITKYDLRWRGGLLIEDDVKEFARELLQKAQNYIDSAPTIMRILDEN